MFSQIRKVDLEIHNYCNRACKWCPNYKFKREKYEELPEKVYIQVLKDLRDSNFGKWRTAKDSPVLTFTRYNDPLTKPNLLIKRIQQAREILPIGIRFEVNTNGDYLTKDLLAKLDLDALNIMDYDCKGLEYWKSFLEGIGVMITNVSAGGDTIIGISSKIKKICCKVNWPQNCKIENRGGTVDTDIECSINGEVSNIDLIRNGERRKLPCVEPMYMITIESNGNVMPCYNMRSDISLHKEFILGNIKEDSLMDIYNSENTTEIRKRIISTDWENFPKQCQYCNRIRPGYYPDVYYCKSWSNEDKFKDTWIYAT